MSMYQILLEAHSGWRHLIVLIVAIAVIRFLYGLIRSSDWNVWDERLSRFMPIIIDIQLLLGLVVWIMGRQWLGYNTLAAWEHPVTMILVAVTAHVARIRVKNQTESVAKFRSATIWTVVTALLLTIGVLRITHVF